MTNIAITGVGIVSAIGNNTATVLDSLLNEKSGVGQMVHLQSEHRELPVGEVKLSDEQLKDAVCVAQEEIVSRTALLGAYAVRQAIEDAGIDISACKRVALVSGTTVGGMDITERYYSKIKSDDALLSVLKQHDCGTSSQLIADICHLDAEVCTISTACSSALNAIMLGAEMLKNGEADLVIAGGTEALSKFHLNGFNTLIILDGKRCRPFDDSRAGINLGEGAAFVILQREEDAKETARAFISGYANTCDAFHQTASSDNGQGAFLSMSQALAMAELQPEDIQYVNAHGTGTPNNDLTESVALQRVFGDHLPYISSTKAFTGHTTSASGSIELVISLLAMEHSFIPTNLGWKNPIEGGILPSTGNTACELEHVMCNSFGFGGNDSSLIISRKPMAGKNAATQEYEVEIAAESLITDVEQLKESKEFIPPMEARRMGKLLKAATMTSMRALKEAGVTMPDAIITATALGMLENSEKFLDDIVENGESLLKPTLFMQSTHNTIGSAVAIRLGCHGYNITYTQGADSWKWAMHDAERLIRSGKAESVLVGCHDESTPLVNEFCRRGNVEELPLIYSRSVVLKRK